MLSNAQQMICWFCGSKRQTKPPRPIKNAACTAVKQILSLILYDALTAAVCASKRCRVTVLQPEHCWLTHLKLVAALRKCCFSFWSSASSSGSLLLDRFHSPSEIIKTFELRNGCEIVCEVTGDCIARAPPNVRIILLCLKSRVQNN